LELGPMAQLVALLELAQRVFVRARVVVGRARVEVEARSLVVGLRARGARRTHREHDGDRAEEPFHGSILTQYCARKSCWPMRSMEPDLTGFSPFMTRTNVPFDEPTSVSTILP